MAKYIDREALLKHLCNSCDGWCENTECDCVHCKSEHRCDMVQEMDDCPAADVATVVHGEWEMLGDKCANCTNCGTIFEALPTEYVFKANNKFCRNCGAKMDGERKGDDGN